MADTNHTTPDSGLPFWRGIQPYDEKVDPDPFDTLYEKLYHLDALLEVSYDITGSGGGLRVVDEATQNNYLWACAKLAHKCVVLIEHHKEKVDDAEIRARRKS